MKLPIILSLVLLILGACIFLGCNNKMTTAKQKAVPAFEVSYKKSKGKSKTKPQFEIALKGTKVAYNGIANVAALGEQTYDISSSKVATIKQAFEGSKFSEFEAEYKGRIRDLPMMTLTYKGHQVRYQEKAAPDSLKALATLMEGLAPKKKK